MSIKIIGAGRRFINIDYLEDGKRLEACRMKTGQIGEYLYSFKRMDSFIIL